MRRVKVAILVATATGALACGSSAPSPIVPSPTAPAPVPPPQIPGVNVFSGTVRATNGGQLLSGITVTFAGQTAVTDGAGAFSFSVAGSPSSGSVQLSGSSIVTRNTSFSLAPHSGIALDAFHLDSTFDLTFYRAFVRDGFAFPTRLQPVRRLLQAPKLYIKTVDEAGQPIDAVTLDTVERAMNGTAASWMGGRFGFASIERGTGTREGISGYLTVKWPNPALVGICGRSTIGIDGGAMQLNYLLQPVPGVSGSCGCGGSAIRAITAKHELGHAVGYFHTGDPQDLMSGLAVQGCDQAPSARELAHAVDAYSRANGNVDPDNDPTSVSFSVRPSAAPVIDN